MKRIITAVFENEERADEGLEAMKALHEEGHITLYATAVLVKDPEGTLMVKRPAEKSPIGAIVGMVSGAVVGLLAGPFGAFAGASIGGIVGTARDLRQAGMDLDFIDEIARTLLPGRAAVLAEIQEEVTAPLDQKVKALGGTLVRRLRSEIIEDMLAREVENERLEISELETELAEVDEQLSAEVQREIAEAKQKLAKTRKTIESRLASLTEEHEARIRFIEKEMEGASDRKKAHIQRRIVELKSDYEARSGKLRQAELLIRDAGVE